MCLECSSACDPVNGGIQKGKFHLRAIRALTGFSFSFLVPIQISAKQNVNLSWLTWDAHEGALLFLTVFPKSKIAKKL